MLITRIYVHSLMGQQSQAMNLIACLFLASPMVAQPGNNIYVLAVLPELIS